MKRNAVNNPSSIFYWKDYENDEGLRVSSLAAQGLWMRLLCIAAKAEPFGFILINGHPLDATGAARLAGVTEGEAAALIQELEHNGVFSRDRKGRMFSRRMVKEAAISAKNRKNGKKGGNPRLSVSDCNIIENQESVNPPLKPPLKPPLPLSTSPHSDTSYPHKQEEEEEGAQARGEQPGRPPAEPPDKAAVNAADSLWEAVVHAVGHRSGNLPTHWLPPAASAHVWRWVSDLGLSPEQVIEAARSSRKQRPEPPNGPKALDATMRNLAAVLAAPKLEPAPGPRPISGARHDRPSKSQQRLEAFIAGATLRA